jgi:hypothetical protein
MQLLKGASEFMSGVPMIQNSFRSVGVLAVPGDGVQRLHGALAGADPALDEEEAAQPGERVQHSNGVGRRPAPTCMRERRRRWNNSSRLSFLASRVTVQKPVSDFRHDPTENTADQSREELLQDGIHSHLLVVEWGTRSGYTRRCGCLETASPGASSDAVLLQQGGIALLDASY